MSIIYTLISRGATVFCEHTGDRGNFQQVTRTILEKIDTQEDAKHSYAYDGIFDRQQLQKCMLKGEILIAYALADYTFHIIVQGGITYLAMTSKTFDRKVAFDLLEAIKTEFEARYSEMFATAVAFEMNKTFAKAMSDKVDHYNKHGSDLEAGVAASAEGRGAEKIQKVRGEIEEVKQVMTENIDRILERGDKIELLVDKSSHLQEQASKFKKSSTQLKRAMWYNNMRFQACIIISAIVLGLIVVLPATKCFGLC